MQSRKAYEENNQTESKAMFLATAYDKASEAWTGCSPNPLVSDPFELNLVAFKSVYLEAL